MSDPPCWAAKKSVFQMKAYRDVDGDSGVIAYEYGDDFIRVQFESGKIYTYHESSIGSAHLAAMKSLADSGDGLNAYINTHREVKFGYSR